MAGQFLATALSSELYQKWIGSLNNPAGRGTFSITRFALAEIPVDRAAPLTFVGSGTFTAEATGDAVPFVVAATVTRTTEGWRVTGARYDRYEGGR